LPSASRSWQNKDAGIVGNNRQSDEEPRHTVTDQPEPPIRLILAALFMAARLVRDDHDRVLRERLIGDSVADADELLRQVPL